MTGVVLCNRTFVNFTFCGDATTPEKLDKGANTSYYAFLSHYNIDDPPKKCQDAAIAFSCYLWFHQCSGNSQFDYPCKAACESVQSNCHLIGPPLCDFYPTSQCTPTFDDQWKATTPINIHE